MAEEQAQAQGEQGQQQSQQQAAASWRDSLPDDLRANPTLAPHPDVASLAKEHINLQSLIGKKGVIPPGEKDPPEAWDRFYNQLGRPESPDKYDLNGFKPPEGLPWQPEVQSAMLKEMHAAGLSNKQAARVLAKYAEMQGAQWNDLNGKIGQSVEQNTVALKKDWGAAYDAKVDVANRAFAFAAGDQMEAFRQVKLADGTYAGDNPLFVRMFAKIGEAMSEDTLKGSGGRRMSMTPDEAKGEIARMEGDKEIAAKMADRNHPEYGALNAKRNALYASAYPEGQA